MSPGLLDETAEVQSSCPFFRAREAAESWAEGRTGVAVLTVEQGYELARAHWIEARRSAESRERSQRGG